MMDLKKRKVVKQVKKTPAKVDGALEIIPEPAQTVQSVYSVGPRIRTIRG